ncbi:glutathione-disulfide reductase [Roseomonas sp. SSH11]|uniref:Glutathione-disulfide reductase n=1 Tax=Pararoseomonas baculiformis TaxID=2820812 RepID=A0ABS4AHJ7_9PROT|nr:glutathione-disulfide reductase [Pararoseomonas baculiformis]MBP0446507.1 glutathione-disulfide reductase [Pararoseomonas baculiformis]
MSAPHPYDFDLFVIGGGSAGVRMARISAGHGAKVGIAEGRFWGGTCVNVGCVPKKIMVQAAEYGAWARDAEAFGWTNLGDPQHDWATLARARDMEVARLSGIYSRMLGGVGVEIFECYAHFTGPHELKVGDRTVTANRIVIATGGNPVRPEIPGGEHAYISDDLFTLKEMPRRVLVVGGGYIGLEFASMLNGLGAEVTLAYRQSLPLRGFDQEIREAVAEALAADGVTILSGETPASITREGETRITRMGSGKMVEADAVFYAIGRKPATKGLGLDAAGINCREGGVIAVDDDHATNVPHIYALGDVTDRVNLTPVATAMGHALADTLFGPKPRRASYENVPKAVFTSPPIGSVGLTEDEAALRGPVEIYTTRFTPMRHTITRREGRKTVMKLVVEAGTGCLLGAHMIGEDSPEIMQGIAVAVANRLTKAQLDATIGIHPTAAEEFVTMRVATRRVGEGAAKAA